MTGQMLERTVSTLHYAAYDIFVGVYPNDELTVRAVTEVARQHPRVQVAMLPHPGPTSKGDCLNCVYRRMQEHEERTGEKYEIIVTHDAEDVVHPESLRLISWFAADYAMVQIPVLALPTPGHELTHGLYCDEFAEYQLKDIPVRQALDGFLPSNGVGCGFERKALERLAESREGRIFDPASLTEDYENGLQLHAMGYRQIFVPVRFEGGAPMATREYFPRRRRAAARQTEPLDRGNRAARVGAARVARDRGGNATGCGGTGRGWWEICSRRWRIWLTSMAWCVGDRSQGRNIGRRFTGVRSRSRCFRLACACGRRAASMDGSLLRFRRCACCGAT